MNFAFRTALISKEEHPESSAQSLPPHLPVSLPEGLLRGSRGGRGDGKSLVGGTIVCMHWLPVGILLHLFMMLLAFPVSDQDSVSVEKGQMACFSDISASKSRTAVLQKGTVTCPKCHHQKAKLIARMIEPLG